MKLFSLIKTRDLLGESINFSINKQSSFQTVAGGSLSITICILYVYFFYFFGLDFIFKQNPIVYSQIRNLRTESTPIINLTSNDFIFAVRFEDILGKPIDYEEYLFDKLIYSVDIYDKTNQTFKERNYELEMTNCTKFPKIKEKVPDTIFDLKTFRCPDLSKSINNTIQLGGRWEDNYVQFLRYEINLCKDAQRKNCKRDSDLIERLKKEEEVVISIIYPTIIFNADNYTNPFEFTFTNFYNYISLGFSFRDELIFGYNHLNQDAGIIFESNEDKREIGGLRVDSKNILRLKYNNGNIMWKEGSIYTMSIFFGREYLYHTRKYMKFQDLLANVSGFMELLLMILGFVYKIYNKFRLDSYLFNRLVFIKGDFKEDLFHKNKNQQERNTLTNPKIIKEDNNLSLNFPPNANKNTINLSKENEHNKDYSKLSRENNNQNLSRKFKLADTIELNNITYKNDSIREGSGNLSANRILIGRNQEGIDKLDLENIPPLNQTQISNLNLNENQNESLRTIEKHKVERIIDKMRKQKNDIRFSFKNYCYQSLMCSKNKVSNKIDYNLYKQLEKYSEKIYEKFDVFNYLKNLRSVKYMKKLLFEKEQISILDKISEKFYGVNFSNISRHELANDGNCQKEDKLKLSIEKIYEYKSPDNKIFLDFICLLD